MSTVSRGQLLLQTIDEVGIFHPFPSPNEYRGGSVCDPAGSFFDSKLLMKDKLCQLGVQCRL